MLNPPSLDRIQGSVLGGVIGDVVGAVIEGASIPNARAYVSEIEQYKFCPGLSGLTTHNLNIGHLTDDSQLSRVLLRSLMKSNGLDPEDFAKDLADAFRLNKIVGFGGSTHAAAMRLIAGESWRSSGTPSPAAGNGAAMRCAPVGLWYWRDMKALVRATVLQAKITHTDPMAVSFSVVMATATAMCVNASRETSNPAEKGWWEWLARLSGTVDSSTEDLLRTLIHKMFTENRGVSPHERRDVVHSWVGSLQGNESPARISGWAVSSVLWSLYCLMEHPKDLWGAICTAIYGGGDTDTTAAMAGNLVGAHIGLSNFPIRVLQTIATLVHDPMDSISWASLEEESLAFAKMIQRCGEEGSLPP